MRSNLSQTSCSLREVTEDQISELSQPRLHSPLAAGVERNANLLTAQLVLCPLMSLRVQRREWRSEKWEKWGPNILALS